MSSASNPLIASRASYAASLIQSIAFGVYLVISLQAIMLQLQLRHRRRQERRSHQSGGRITVQKALLTYSSVMLVVVCTWYALAAITDEKTSVEHEKGACKPLGITREALGTLMIWSADGLLLWRMYVIWDANLWICIVPLLIFLSSLGMGIALNLSCLSTTSSGPIKVISASHLSAPFIGLSIALNVTATALITFRLLQHRRRLVQAGFERSHTRTYSSLLGIIVESALLYTVAGLLFLPFLVKKNPLATAFSTCFIVTAFLAPGLIQLRIARGTAYSRAGASSDLGSSVGPNSGPGIGPRSTMRTAVGPPVTNVSVALDTHVYPSEIDRDMEPGMHSWRDRQSNDRPIELWDVKK